MEAEQYYTSGLTICPFCFDKERAVLFSNRAAAKFRLVRPRVTVYDCFKRSLYSVLYITSNLQDKFEDCIDDCSKAIEIDSNYLKAILRRAEAYEKTEKLDEALTDYTKVLEIDPGLHHVRQTCMVSLVDDAKIIFTKCRHLVLHKFTLLTIDSDFYKVDD